MSADSTPTTRPADAYREGDVVTIANGTLRWEVTSQRDVDGVLVHLWPLLADDDEREVHPRWEGADLLRRVPNVTSQPCKWFALCENAATGALAHPILGDVPICDRCRALADGHRTK